MKRISIIAATLLFCITAANAYNPPVNGDGLFELSSARMLSTASSVTGGGLFNGNPSSVTVNPALTVDEQRIALNAGFTMLFSTDSSNDKSVGTAMQIGGIVPTKWTVMTFYLNGVFVPFYEMNLNDSVNFKFGMSKQVTEKCSIGLGLNTGYLWGAGKDWSLSGNVGLLYNQGNVGFLKDVRFGASVLNIGKNYNKASAIGMNPTEKVTEYPSLLTIKAGVAGLLVSSPSFDMGFSLDVTTPMFQNIMIDAGLECSINNLVYISVAEKFNLNEFANGINDFIPSIGVGMKFHFGFKDNEYFDKKGWAESELSTTAAYKQMYGTVNAISTEVDLKLGMEDSTPPVITLWLDEGDE